MYVVHEDMDQKFDFDLQRCISAFQQGKYDVAVQFLPQLQQSAVLQASTTEFKTPINNTPSKNVSLLHLAAYHGWIEIIRTLIPSAPLTLYKDSLRQTYLHYAALGGMFEMLVYLIKDNICDPKTRGHKNMPLLHYASSGGNMDIIRYIIREQLQPCNLMIYCGSLHLACLSGHLNVVKYFVADQNCASTSRDLEFDTPLHYASKGGHLHIIDYLITVEKCDPMTENVGGILPLHYACRKGHLNVVKYFIANQKCGLTSRDKFGNTPLHHAWVGGHMNIIQYLCSCVQEYNPLQFACICGPLDVIKYFIDKKTCDPKCRDQNGKTLLHYASEGGHMNIIKFLITEKHCDPKTPNTRGVLPLHIACLHGHLNVVKYFIIEQYCNPTSLTIDGDTPLHYASKGGHINIVEYLITQQNCNPRTSNSKKLFPLHIACIHGHLNVVKFYCIILKLFMVSITGIRKDPNGNTLLHYATEGGNKDVVKYLITERLCHPRTSNYKGLLPLHTACLHGHLNLVKFYITEQKFGGTSLGPNGDTLLHYASEGGHVDIIEYLLTQQQYDLRSTNSMETLPVHVACLHGHLNVVKYFITKLQCEPTIQAKNGKTLLHYASESGHLNIVEYLAEETQCDPMTADNNGILPLHLACLKGQLKVVKYFITNHKCDPSSQDQNGWTTLHYASKGGHMDIIKYLITDHGDMCDTKTLNESLLLACGNGHFEVIKYFINKKSCDPKYQDQDRKTSLHYASQGGDMNIIRFLITEEHCDSKIPNVSGVLPLHIACLHGHLNVIKYFITEQYCNPTSQTIDGDTPLHYASKGGHEDIVRYLTTSLGHDPRTSNSKGLLPIHIACIHGHLNVVKLYISRQNFGETSLGPNDDTLLHYASEGGHEDIVKYLITEGHCQPRTSNNNGLLPIHTACLHGHLNVVKFYQSFTGTGKSQGPNGDTLLHYASEGGHEDIVKYLSIEGHYPNFIGLLPLHTACIHGHLNVVKFYISSQNFTKTCLGPNGNTLLHYASEGGHEDIARYLIAKKICDPKVPNNKGLLPLHTACLHGHLKLVKFYITEQKYTSQAPNGDTLLHYASEGGHLEIIEYLLTQQHYNPKSINNMGILPVHVACLHGHLNVVKCFVTKLFCDPEGKANGGKTLLHYASEGGHLNIIEYLVEETQCDPMTADNKGILSLHLACLKGRLKVVKHFITNHKCDPSSRDKNGWTTLHYASMGGHINIIKYLITDHGDICDTKTLNESLQLACTNGHFKLFKYFINERICNPKHQDQDGKTLLHYASQGGDMNIIRFLTEEHCASKTQNICGILPLHIACLHGHLNLVKYFIVEQNCSPTSQTIEGDTSLHYASKGGHEDIVEYLITWQHCNPKHSNSKGLLPLHNACIHGHLKLIMFYISKQNLGGTCLGPNGDTLLHYASEGGHEDIVSYLIEKGICDPLSSNNKGLLPIHTACLNGRLSIVKFYQSFTVTGKSQGPNGDTLLHYASEGGHVDIIDYLLNQQHYNPKSSNSMGILPVHVACLHGHLNVVKHFIIKLQCDPTIQDNDGKTLLHYASEGGHLNIIEYLLVEETQCDPTTLNDSLHLACSNGHLNVVKYFINIQFLDPSEVLDKDGRTLLHTGCYFKHTHIVEWLLHEGTIDVMAKDNKRRTCIDLATNCYPLLKLFKPLVDSKKSFPIHSYNKVVLTGNSGAGKTTLAKVISERAMLKTYLYHWITGTLLDQVELCTAGIIPSYINSREVGNIVLYDLAGHAEYHSSHSAIMERVMQQSPATFITVIDFSNKITEIKQQLHYWLNFIDCITRKTTVGSCTLIVVGSHADLFSKEEIQVKSTLVKECLQQGQVQRQQFIDIVTIDCRNIVAIDQFIKILNNCQQIIADRTPSISYYCHLLYAFLKNKKWTVCSFNDIFSIFSKEDLSITPDQLTEHLDTLSDRGMIIFLKNQHYLDRSWIVVDTEALLKNIGILFAPKTFKEHHPEISDGSIGPGIICSSNLKNLFDGYDLDMLVGFLEILELCHCVTNICEATVNIQNIEALPSPDLENIHLFIPSLLDNKRPAISSNNDEGFSFGWCLCCKDKEYYFFGNRFLHVLLLRLAYVFKLHQKHREYTVWLDGISWDNEEGYRIVVELVDHKRCVMVVMSHMTRSRKVKLIKCRSKVIRLILNLKQEFCPHMETAEYLISPSKLQKWPEDNVHFPDDGDLLSIVNAAESMLKKSPYILSLKGTSEECNSTEQVLLDEPYHLMKTSTVCDLMDDNKKNKLISSPSVLREVNNSCHLNQSDLSPTCHLCLRECVDRLSIFAGRDPIVSACRNKYFCKINKFSVYNFM